MPPRLRFAPPSTGCYWLHLTQRGNNKQPVFTADQDRHHFLTLVGSLSEERQVRVAAYTLMTNHFHLVAVGDQIDAISLVMMNLNGQYATYRNATQRTTRCTIGHVWQHRFYSCVQDMPIGKPLSATSNGTPSALTWPAPPVPTLGPAPALILAVLI